MSLLANLMGRIFGSGDKPEEALAAASQTAGAEASSQPSSQVDVAARLEAMKAAHPEGENLDWKRSIVDLMILAGVDSSYGARKELALELGYSREDIDRKGSAEMNIWLRQQLMAKLAENGGVIPAELRE